MPELIVQLKISSGRGFLANPPHSAPGLCDHDVVMLPCRLRSRSQRTPPDLAAKGRDWCAAPRKSARQNRDARCIKSCQADGGSTRPSLA